jgi:hypothetical protein
VVWVLFAGAAQMGMPTSRRVIGMFISMDLD